MTPYTYLIGWTKLGKYYYGVRYSKNCDPSDLWTTYYTSSRHVHQFHLEHGEPDLIRVRKKFDTKEQAILHEHTVLRRMKAVERLDFLNRTYNRGIPPEFAGKMTMLGKKHRPESIEKMKKKHEMPTNISEIASIRASKKFGSKNAMFKGYIHTPKGVFETVLQAAKAEGVTTGQLNYWIQNDRLKYNDYYRVRD